MAIGEITNPYEFFTNADGTPLEAGQIYIGVDGLDPQDNPQAAYFDLAGTIGATQPIRTLGGYPVNAGSAAKIFTNGSFSVKVLDENNNLVYSDLSVSQIEDSVDAVTARVDDMAVPFDTVADFFAASIADIKTAANATTGTVYIETSDGQGRYTVDLTQAASFDITTTSGVEASYARPNPASVDVGEYGTAAGGDIFGVLNQAMTAPFPLQLGAGEYTQSAKVTAGSARMGGGGVKGVGRFLNNSDSDAVASLVRWTGADAATMMELDSVKGLVFADMAVSGRADDADATQQAGVYHHWRKTLTAGSGVSFYENMDWRYFDTVIKCGDDAASTNCADLTFKNSGGNYVDRFLHVLNNQGVNYHFQEFSMNFSDRIAHFERGGNLYVYGANFAGCGYDNPMFEISAGDDSVYANSINNMRLEQNCQKVLKLVGAGVSISNMTEAQGNQAQRQYEVLGGTLEISNSRLVTHNAVDPTFFLNTHSGRKPRLILRNVFFDVEDFIPSEWFEIGSTGATHVITLENCYYGQSRTPIPNSSTDPAYGLTNVSGSTVGTSNTNLLLLGLTTRSVYSTPQVAVNTAAIFEVSILGISSTSGNAYATVRSFAVQNDGDVVTLIGSETLGTDINTLGLTNFPTVNADDPYNGIRINVVGKSGENIEWSAGIRLLMSRDI